MHGACLQFVHTRSFSDTAGEFDVEVSTVSRALTSLENALGQTLILRVTRPLQLTESGKIAYEHASNILLQHEEMVKELTQSSAGMAGKIRLSLAPGSVAVYIPMLMEFNSQYPEIVFDIVGGGNIQDILQYKADISVASFKSKDPRIVSFSRGRNVYVPVASRHYIEEHGLPLHPKDLAAHTLLVYDGTVRPATRYLENGDRREEVRWKQVLRVSNILAIKKSVIDGLGISVDLPLFHCAQEIASGVLVPILPGWVHPPVECFVCTSKNQLAHSPPPRISAVVPNAPGSVLQEQRGYGCALLGHSAAHHCQRNLEASCSIDRVASLHCDLSGLLLEVFSGKKHREQRGWN